MKKTMTKVADEVRDDLDQARSSATEALTKASRLDLFDGLNGHAKESAAHAKEALTHSVHALRSTAQDTAEDTVKKAKKKAHKAQKKAKKRARKVATVSRRRGPVLAGIALCVALVGGVATVLARRQRS